jgi:geranylgeranyl diphosphate synthase, type I
VTSPLDAADLRARVQPLIDTALTEQGAILTSVGDDLTPMIESLQCLLAGGKRLRPAFCYWGWRSTGYDLALTTRR